MLFGGIELVILVRLFGLLLVTEEEVEELVVLHLLILLVAAAEVLIIIIYVPLGIIVGKKWKISTLNIVEIV